MASGVNLASLKKRHNDLHKSVLELQATQESAPVVGELEKLNASLDDLLEALRSLPTEGMSAADYEWLSDALLRWQILSTATLKKPRKIEVPDPPSNLLPDSVGPLSAERVQDLLRQKAAFQSRLRRARHLVEELEKVAKHPSNAVDWHVAKVHFAYEVLCGKMQLARLSAASFGHLAEVWLDEVKLVWAYFHWKGRGEPLWEDTHDYFTAENLVRRRLHEAKERKLVLQDFEEVELFIRREYLVQGKVADGKIPSPAHSRIKKLIGEKAFRLSLGRPQARGEEERKAGEMGDWLNAEKYVADFYEGIIAAVPAAQGEPDSAKRGVESRQRVITAIHNESIVNAFEAAIIGYYL